MDKKLKIYLGFLVLLFATIIIIDSKKPKPINWTPTYAVKDKIPFGLHILQQELADLSHQKITEISTTPYEYLDPLFDYDSLVNNYKIKGTLLNISEFTTIDASSLTEMFYFESHENAVFLSMKSFPKPLLDSLKIELKSDFKFNDSIYNWVANLKLKPTKYHLIELCHV